jgi:hypothetical protein
MQGPKVGIAVEFIDRLLSDLRRVEVYQVARRLVESVEVGERRGMPAEEYILTVARESGLVMAPQRSHRASRGRGEI